MASADPTCLATALAAAVRPLLRPGGEDPPIVFVSGGQGLGKSTAVAHLPTRLGVPVAAFSIDDLYLTRQARLTLAGDVHPLFAVRGPPGTHDLDLGHRVLDALRAGRPIAIPSFDKVTDDRRPRSAWPAVEVRPALIVVEGWLMGVLPDLESPGASPMNAVEQEDPAGCWRAHQEKSLAGPYAAFWDRADAFVHLDAPSFERIVAWRTEAEARLQGIDPTSPPDTLKRRITRFCHYYERLARRMLAGRRHPGARIAVDDLRSVREGGFPASSNS